MMELEDLNDQQLQAVKHGAGPLLVVAGAGTGKTQVITRRIAHLIGAGQAKPEEILALTFTEKAAAEMLDRLDGLIGWLAHRVGVMTFHAFGVQILQRYGHHGGFSTRAELVPQTMKAVLLEQHLSEVRLSYYGRQDDIIDFLESAVSFIESLQNAGVDCEEFGSYVKELEKRDGIHELDVAEARDKLELYQLYEKLKRQNGLIDYNDQITLALRLLQEKANLAERLRAQYKFVMVDEYQDTNATQDALLKAIVPPRGNIFVVGDDDQAIYGFRGARLSNILEFADYFGVDRPLVLTQNYRSTQPILNSAYKLIRHNDPDRLEVRLNIQKRLVGLGGGKEPEFCGYATRSDELYGVAEALKQRLKGQAADSMAVLATSHSVLQALAKVLRQLNVPYALSSMVNVFEHQELLQLWYLLRWIGFRANDEAVIQLLLGPYVEWPSNKVRTVTERARKQLITIEEAVEGLANGEAAATELVNKLHLWRSWAQTSPPSQIVYRLIFESELKDRWIEKAQKSARILRLFEDLQMWMTHMQQFEGVALSPTLSNYLETFPKPPQLEAEAVSGEERGVALLTVHAAKGLEFESVFIINNTREAWTERSAMEVNKLPHELDKDKLDLPPEHERRRLLYVAMTRAKRELIISATTRGADGRARKLSPFLPEIFDQANLIVEEASNKDKLSEALIKLQRSAPLTHETRLDFLPFESSDGWLELSATDIDKYDYCPYEFFLEKVLKIRSPVGPQVQFGSILHGLFHEYYRSRLEGEPSSMASLEQLLEERWTRLGYRSQEEADVDFERAKATLKLFYRREETLKRKVLASELGFKLVIEEAKLRISGQVDACFELPEGLEVRDFKTGRQRDPEKLAEKAKGSLQLRTYALAMAEMHGELPAKIVLDYVVTGVEGVASLSKIIMRNHRLKLVEIAEKIRQRNFRPKTGAHHQCMATRYWGTADEDDERVGIGSSDAG